MKSEQGPDIASGARELWAGLLVGGASRRMGEPKSLLPVAGVPLAERALAAVRSRVIRTVLLGTGKVPATLQRLSRLDDAPEIAGPMAGVLAALRHRPAVTWLVVACDQGWVSPEAVDWLLTQRAPGLAALLPRRSPGRVEPFFALYEPPALALVERLVADGVSSLQRLAGLPGVASPWPPPRLRSAWRDADTPADLVRLDRPIRSDT